MKRRSGLLFAAGMLLALSACGDERAAEQEAAAPPPPVVRQADESPAPAAQRGLDDAGLMRAAAHWQAPYRAGLPLLLAQRRAGAGDALLRALLDSMVAERRRLAANWHFARLAVAGVDTPEWIWSWESDAAVLRRDVERWLRASGEDGDAGVLVRR